MKQGESKPIDNYAQPTGPAGSTNGPGLGGINHGNAGTQNGVSPQTSIGPGQKGPYSR